MSEIRKLIDETGMTGMFLMAAGVVMLLVTVLVFTPYSDLSLGGFALSALLMAGAWLAYLYEKEDGL